MSSPLFVFEDRDIRQASFGDTFSGRGWLQAEKTTLYHDTSITAFTFPPRVQLKPVEGRTPFSSSSVSLQGSQVSFCIEISCLRNEANTLTIEENGTNRPLALPESVRSETVRAVSIGRLKTKWMVGITVKTEGMYRGLVFSLSGETFTEVFNGETTPFVSPYSGALGFGGDDRDWIAVYGGYKGMAVRVKSGEIINLSHFLGIRPMKDGFYPSVVRVPSRELTHWYLFSLSRANPRLIKLFENQEGDISGALDLTALLGLDRFESVALASERNRVFALTREGGREEMFELIDNGFEKTKKLEAASENINHYPAEVRGVTLSPVLSRDGAETQFSVSNDGIAWYTVFPEKPFIFPDAHGRSLFWRAEFTPRGSVSLSPFFTEITVSYKVKFL